MKLGYVICYVNDVKKAMTFYSRVFGLTEKFLHDSETYGEMDTGSTTLAFARFEVLKDSLGLEPPRDGGTATELALVTDDVDESYRRAVEAGARELAAPTRKPWGQTVSYVRDPFGILVEICSPVE